MFLALQLLRQPPPALDDLAAWIGLAAARRRLLAPTTMFGNTCTGASVDGYALDVVTSASAAGPWWSHIAAVLLYDKAPLGDALWAWLDVNLGKGRIELRHYFTPKVRRFILVCTCCVELFFMCYDKHLTDEVKNARVNDLAAFTHCTDALKRKGSCPRLRSDNLLRILK